MSQGSSGNVIAALVSFFLPGLGQLIQGRILAALVHFVERVGADEAEALRRALAELEANQRNNAQSAGAQAED